MTTFLVGYFSSKFFNTSRSKYVPGGKCFNNSKLNTTWDLITYADDIVIFISDQHVSSIETKLNMDLENKSAYFHFNELVINLKKKKQRLRFLV